MKSSEKYIYTFFQSYKSLFNLQQLDSREKKNFGKKITFTVHLTSKKAFA